MHSTARLQYRDCERCRVRYLSRGATSALCHNCRTELKILGGQTASCNTSCKDCSTAYYSASGATRSCPICRNKATTTTSTTKGRETTDRHKEEEETQGGQRKAIEAWVAAERGAVERRSPDFRRQSAGSGEVAPRTALLFTSPEGDESFTSVPEGEVLHGERRTERASIRPGRHRNFKMPAAPQTPERQHKDVHKSVESSTPRARRGYAQQYDKHESQRLPPTHRVRRIVNTPTTQSKGMQSEASTVSSYDNHRHHRRRTQHSSKKMRPPVSDASSEEHYDRKEPSKPEPAPARTLSKGQRDPDGPVLFERPLAPPPRGVSLSSASGVSSALTERPEVGYYDRHDGYDRHERQERQADWQQQQLVQRINLQSGQTNYEDEEFQFDTKRRFYHSRRQEEGRQYQPQYQPQQQQRAPQHQAPQVARPSFTPSPQRCARHRTVNGWDQYVGDPSPEGESGAVGRAESLGYGVPRELGVQDLRSPQGVWEAGYAEKMGWDNMQFEGTRV